MSLTQVSPSLDQVILVDDHDQEIGVMDKLEAHRGDGKLHRAISVFLFNDQGELLIQQRSAQKIVGAGQWANTCCGNVRPGETYEQCAYRRLKEELGIAQVKLQEVFVFQYSVKCNQEFSEREIDHVFMGKYQAEVESNPSEVAATAFKKITDMQLELKTQPEKYAPWFQIMLQKPDLLAKFN